MGCIIGYNMLNVIYWKLYFCNGYIVNKLFYKVFWSWIIVID